jgi:hypothetical protein
MIFLIEYNRPEGRIVTFKTFTESDRSLADQTRHELELDLNRKGIDHEVVILQAGSEEAIRRTHRRYFEDAHQMLKSVNVNDDL